MIVELEIRVPERVALAWRAREHRADPRTGRCRACECEWPCLPAHVARRRLAGLD
ncbi:MAG TPA: hypothetical protein VL652_34770 [Kutzneria sp.]|jgi:hypothetical protein|nr:hypothetical protein [Kutzneria sp.]